MVEEDHDHAFDFHFHEVNSNVQGIKTVSFQKDLHIDRTVFPDKVTSRENSIICDIVAVKLHERGYVWVTPAATNGANWAWMTNRR